MAGGDVRAAGWRIGLLVGLLELVAMGLLCVGVSARPGGENPGPKTPSISAGAMPALKPRQILRSGTESPRVQADRRFLARRGIGPIGPARHREKQVFGLAQDDKSHEMLSGQITPQGGAVPVWGLVGPVGVNSISYGLVTGRVSAIALDPADVSGNRVFVGTTGGGLWKSQNGAASAAASVQFLPVTDGLGALSGVADAGTLRFRLVCS